MNDDTFIAGVSGVLGRENTPVRKINIGGWQHLSNGRFTAFSSRPANSSTASISAIFYPTAASAQDAA
jgi:hypothetical protein